MGILPVAKMADEENIEVEGDKNEEPKGKKAAKHDDVGTADLEKVTDYVEEAEISSQSISDAMKVMSDKKAKEATEKQLRERELAKIKISKEDVDLIENEMEIPRSVAERKLREHKGDVVQALVELTN